MGSNKYQQHKGGTKYYLKQPFLNGNLGRVFNGISQKSAVLITKKSDEWTFEVKKAKQSIMMI